MGAPRQTHRIVELQVEQGHVTIRGRQREAYRVLGPVGVRDIGEVYRPSPTNQHEDAHCTPKTAATFTPSAPSGADDNDQEGQP